MADTLNFIKEIMQSNVEFITDEQRLRPKDSEVFRLKGDNALIHELTGWTPKFTLSQGLKETNSSTFQPFNFSTLQLFSFSTFKLFNFSPKKSFGQPFNQRWQQI